jgi:hypothetical protein
MKILQHSSSHNDAISRSRRFWVLLVSYLRKQERLKEKITSISLCPSINHQSDGQFFIKFYTVAIYKRFWNMREPKYLCNDGYVV